MTEAQYRQVCSIFGRKLTEEELSNMNMSPVNGKWDDDVADNLNLYRQDMRKQNAAPDTGRKRVEVELFDLNIKIEKLEAFLLTEKYRSLSVVSSTLLIMQLHAMRDYRKCLEMRLQNWED